jgi:ATP-binding protein involved in chromosome partitioning
MAMHDRNQRARCGDSRCRGQQQYTEQQALLERQPLTSKLDPTSPIRVAVPVEQGALSPHFGHCEHFVVFDVSCTSHAIQNQQVLTPVRHEPGVLPGWLRDQGVEVVIAGGMGARAQRLFAQHQVKVVVGAAALEPEAAVKAYLEDRLPTGPNPCDH